MFYICITQLQDVWFLHDLKLINIIYVYFFDPNDLRLTFNIKMVIANTQMKATLL